MSPPLQSPDETYGLDLRLRKIEDELSRVKPANIEPITRAPTTQQPSVPPRVSGLALDTVIGGISVQWNGVGITNLKRYEVQISTDPQMVGAQTFFTAETRYTFAGATQGVTYYVRVRAVNTAEAAGDYSGILNTITGLIQTEDIAPGAVTDLVWEELNDIIIETPRVWFETGAIELFEAKVNAPITIDWQLRIGPQVGSAFNVFTGIQVYDGTDYLKGAPEEPGNFLVDIEIPINAAADPISFHTWRWTINPGIGNYRISHWINKDDTNPGADFLEVRSQFLIASQAKR